MMDQTFAPNAEQVKSLVRWFLAWASGVAVGYISTKHWLTVEQLTQVSSFFGSETLVTLIIAIGSAVWGVFAHTHANSVATTAAISDVKRVETMRTDAGVKLALRAGSSPDALVSVSKQG